MNKNADARTPQEEMEHIRVLLIEYYAQKIREIEDECGPKRLEDDLNWELHLIGGYNATYTR